MMSVVMGGGASPPDVDLSLVLRLQVPDAETEKTACPL